MNNSKSDLIFVIEALDESEREDDIKLILRLFIEAKVLTIIRLRVILINRSKVAIRLNFQIMPEIIHQNYDLRDIFREVIKHDIFEFLRHELNKIKKSRDFSTN